MLRIKLKSAMRLKTTDGKQFAITLPRSELMAYYEIVAWFLKDNGHRSNQLYVKKARALHTIIKHTLYYNEDQYDSNAKERARLQEKVETKKAASPFIQAS